MEQKTIVEPCGYCIHFDVCRYAAAAMCWGRDLLKIDINRDIFDVQFTCKKFRKKVPLAVKDEMVFRDIDDERYQSNH